MNQQLAEVFVAQAAQTSANAQKWYSHTLNAHRIWNERIAGTPVSVGVWQLHAPEDYARVDDENHEQTLDLLNTIPLDKRCNYKTTEGAPFTNTAQDILFHIINHSTYHRGQIATDFRRHGLTPLPTDYIFYTR